MTYDQRNDLAATRRREAEAQRSEPRRWVNKNYCSVHGCNHDGVCIMCKQGAKGISNKNTWKILPAEEP